MSNSCRAAHQLGDRRGAGDPSGVAGSGAGNWRLTANRARSLTANQGLRKIVTRATLSCGSAKNRSKAVPSFASRVSSKSPEQRFTGNPAAVRVWAMMLSCRWVRPKIAMSRNSSGRGVPKALSKISNPRSTQSRNRWPIAWASATRRIATFCALLVAATANRVTGRSRGGSARSPRKGWCNSFNNGSQSTFPAATKSRWVRKLWDKLTRSPSADRARRSHQS